MVAGISYLDGAVPLFKKLCNNEVKFSERLADFLSDKEIASDDIKLQLAKLIIKNEKQDAAQ